MSKHTPGPWSVRAGGVGSEANDWIVDFPNLDNVTENDRANFKLIAAAPELFAALELALDSLCSGDNKDAAISAANAALTKVST